MIPTESDAEELLLMAEELVRMIRTGNPETTNDRARRFYDQYVG